MLIEIRGRTCEVELSDLGIMTACDHQDEPQPAYTTSIRIKTPTEWAPADKAAIFEGISQTLVWLAEATGDVDRFRKSEDVGYFEGMLQELRASDDEIATAQRAVFPSE